MPELLIVIGATGLQGGSVISTFLQNGEYKIRGVTRNTESDKAKNLIRRGVEMVNADLNDEQSLVKAFEVHSPICPLSVF